MRPVNQFWLNHYKKIKRILAILLVICMVTGNLQGSITWADTGAIQDTAIATPSDASKSEDNFFQLPQDSINSQSFLQEAQTAVTKGSQFNYEQLMTILADDESAEGYKNIFTGGYVFKMFDGNGLNGKWAEEEHTEAYVYAFVRVTKEQYEEYIENQDVTASPADAAEFDSEEEYVLEGNEEFIFLYINESDEKVTFHINFEDVILPDVTVNSASFLADVMGAASPSNAKTEIATSSDATEEEHPDTELLGEADENNSHLRALKSKRQIPVVALSESDEIDDSEISSPAEEFDDDEEIYDEDFMDTGYDDIYEEDGERSYELILPEVLMKLKASKPKGVKARLASLFSDSESDRVIAAKAAVFTANDLKEQTEPIHNKKIKDNGNGTYRLALDVTAQKKQKLDVLLVVDMSGSMLWAMDGTENASPKQQRITKLRNVLYGNNGNSGFMNKLVAADNHVKVLTFSSKGYDSQNKESKWNDSVTAEMKDLTAEGPSGGTNYMEALKRTDSAFGDLSAEHSGDKKVLVFFSDGVPTFFNNGGWSEAGTGNETNTTSLKSCYDSTLDSTAGKYSINSFKNKNPDLLTFSVGLLKKDSTYPYPMTYKRETLLKKIASQEENYFNAEKEEDLQAAFDNIFASLNGVTIVDTLSQYAELTDLPDYKVTSTMNGAEKELDSKYYTLEKPQSSDKTIKVNIKPEGMVEGAVYTLSYNVRPSAVADSYYKAHGTYPDRGDDETDMAGNYTSSNQEGFYSNQKASLVYGGKTYDYRHPVIQVKKDEPAEEPEHHKRIDWLGDNTSNPDTNLTGANNYRLYLDVKGTPIKDMTPVDVLLLVDESGSMAFPMNGSSATTNPAIQRRTYVEKAAGAAIDAYLYPGSENRMAVIGFKGKGTTYTAEINKYNNGKYSSDKEMLKDIVRYLKAEGGTPYAAAFTSADEVIKSDADKKHDQYIIFITDGEPSIPQTNATTKATAALKTMTPVKGFFAVGVSKVSNTGWKDYLQKDILNAAPAQIKQYLDGSTEKDLQEAFESITSAITKQISHVTIQDTLSQYTEFASDMDVKVTMTDTEGKTTIVDKSLYTLETSDKTICVKFNENYFLEPKCVYTMSFNITVSDEALKTYKEDSNYPDTGDTDTDYMENDTSSLKPGFYSNDNAEDKTYLSYTANDGSHTLSYDKPVIQVLSGKVRFKKIIDGIYVNGSWKTEVTGKDEKEFLVNVTSKGSTLAGMVLRDNGETSSAIEVNSLTNMVLQEIQPLECYKSGNDKNAKQYVFVFDENGNDVTKEKWKSGILDVGPGDDLTVVLHSYLKHSGYFHDETGKTNKFGRNKS